MENPKMKKWNSRKCVCGHPYIEHDYSNALDMFYRKYKDCRICDCKKFKLKIKLNDPQSTEGIEMSENKFNEKSFAEIISNMDMPDGAGGLVGLINSAVTKGQEELQKQINGLETENRSLREALEILRRLSYRQSIAEYKSLVLMIRNLANQALKISSGEK